MSEPKLEEKKWDPKFEKEMSDYWVDNNVYDFNPMTDKAIYCIDTPPPYASGDWHIGRTAHYIQIDMIARTERMMGKEVLFPFCVDRNGLPVEINVEKAHGIKMTETPRQEFVDLCHEHLEKVTNEVVETAQLVGLSCNNWERKYEIGGMFTTDDPKYRAMTQETFIKLFKKGLVYEENRPNNYCHSCHTTIADAEVEYAESNTKLNELKFTVKETGEEIIIATTRPELLPSCGVVLFNPEDERYKHLEGKTAVVPLFKKEVPIKAHSSAKQDFGTGLLMVCSYGDYTDLLTFRELGLKEVISIDTEGHMTEATGKYKGLSVKKARKQIIEDLKEAGLLVNQKDVAHDAPVCWRCSTPVEIIPMKEYYLKQVDFLEDLKKAADQIEFYAPESKQMLLDWINSVSMDWPISRRRYYATEIPLWYCKKCGKTFVPEPGPYYQPWKQNAPGKCECGSEEFEPETRVFDTWMDSSVSEMYVTGRALDPEFFEKNFPCSMRPQGKDIVRTWLYYTMLRAYQLEKKPAFKKVWITHHIVDSQGKKMSTSKGNIVPPRPLLDKYGADTMRLWSCMEGNFLKGDLRCSEDKIKASGKLISKLWNLTRFISMFEEAESTELEETDKWILAEFSKLVEECNEGYKQYNFFIPATRISNFVWNIFASQYVEMVKSRAYANSESARHTLHYVLKGVLKLIAPITPFVTDKLWTSVYSNTSIHKELFPEIEYSNDGLTELTSKIEEFNSSVWKKKKEKGLALNAEIEGQVPNELKIFEPDLKAMHKLK